MGTSSPCCGWVWLRNLRGALRSAPVGSATLWRRKPLPSRCFADSWSAVTSSPRCKLMVGRRASRPALIMATARRLIILVLVLHSAPGVFHGQRCNAQVFPGTIHPAAVGKAWLVPWKDWWISVLGAFRAPTTCTPEVCSRVGLSATGRGSGPVQWDSPPLQQQELARHKFARAGSRRARDES